jgi:transforming growth factor-beta-induced protein
MVHFTCLSFVLAALTLSSSVTVAQNSTSFASILKSDSNLSTLSAATANLTFSNISADPITFFAPTNAAFASLASANLTKLLEPMWIAHLNNVLFMHVVEKKLLSTALNDGDEVTALNNETIMVSIADNGTISVSSPNTNNSVVSAADITGDEGVIHQVDSVLLPSFVTTDLLSLAGSKSGFSIITELLQFSGLGAFVGKDTIATVFAPTDDAFKALGDDALTYYRSDKAATTNLLTGHVLTTVVPTQLMVNGMSIGVGPGGNTFTATVETAADGTTVYKVNNATIVNPNVLAINGIIHALDSILVVRGAEYPPVNSTKPSGPTAPTPAGAPTVKAPTTSDAMTRGYVAGFLFAGIGWVAAVFTE